MTLVAAIKSLHIAGLLVWCAGLMVLPSLFRRRSFCRNDDELHEVQRFTRETFIRIASPAAFVAVGTGTILLFIADVLEPWMFLKLAVVGALAALHARAGYVILGLYGPGRHYAEWRRLAATATTLLVISTILALVLAKPVVREETALPGWLLQPGGLQSLLETMRPMP